MRTGDTEFVVIAGDDLDLCGVVCLLEAQLVDVQEFGWTVELGRQCNGQRAKKKAADMEDLSSWSSKERWQMMYS